MRTTIEITDEQRSKLLAIAASKGIKGFSALVQRALDEFLAKADLNESAVEKALSFRGTLDDDEAFEFAKQCSSLRENWR